MHPDGGGSVLASTTVAGSPPGTDGGLDRPGRLASSGTEISEMLTWVPTGGTGWEARPVTVIRSQRVVPDGTASGCVPLVAATGSMAWPAAVLMLTCVTGGPRRSWRRTPR